jgi:L-fucose isomerase-like protein
LVNPKVAAVTFAFGGYNLGEELAPEKNRQMQNHLAKTALDIHFYKNIVLTRKESKEAGDFFGVQSDIDCILAVITTFVPDHFIIDFLERCNKPIFLWAIEREMQCIALVCGPLITGSLYELGYKYFLTASEIADQFSTESLIRFSRAAMIYNKFKKLTVGYVGGKNNIMFNMSADDITLKKKLGISVEVIAAEEFYNLKCDLDDEEIQSVWYDIAGRAGKITALKSDCLDSAANFLAAKKLVEKYTLGSLSINCFPYLKSKICLAVSQLNDLGIAAGCEGDLHSTILMQLIFYLLNKPAFNGDFLRVYLKKNEVLFSHCGAGAFSLAEQGSCICLRESIETDDGVAVMYPTEPFEKVTLLNMLGTGESLRLSMLLGRGVKTDLEYEATPLRVSFNTHVKDIIQSISENGAGHHWSGAGEDITKEIELLAKWWDIPLVSIS